MTGRTLLALALALALTAPAGCDRTKPGNPNVPASVTPPAPATPTVDRTR